MSAGVKGVKTSEALGVQGFLPCWGLMGLGTEGREQNGEGTEGQGDGRMEGWGDGGMDGERERDGEMEGTEGWRDREMKGWGDGGMGRWRGREMEGTEEWEDGGVGRWRDGGMGRWKGLKDGKMEGGEMGKWEVLLRGLSLHTSSMVFAQTQARGPLGCWSHSPFLSAVLYRGLFPG